MTGHLEAAQGLAVGACVCEAWVLDRQVQGAQLLPVKSCLGPVPIREGAGPLLQETLLQRAFGWGTMGGSCPLSESGGACLWPASSWRPGSLSTHSLDLYCFRASPNFCSWGLEYGILSGVWMSSWNDPRGLVNVIACYHQLEIL